MIEALKIISLAVVAAVVYGICHDQITARVCVEYFTIGHPPVFQTNSPTLLAIGWGVIATWWAGLLVGVPAATLARVGPWPKLTARHLVRPVLRLLIAMSVSSLVFGTIGYIAAGAGAVWLVEPMATRVPESKHVAFLADLWAHSAAYATGLIGGIVICASIALHRRRLANRLTE